MNPIQMVRDGMQDGLLWLARNFNRPPEEERALVAYLRAVRKTGTNIGPDVLTLLNGTLETTRDLANDLGLPEEQVTWLESNLRTVRDGVTEVGTDVLELLDDVIEAIQERPSEDLEDEDSEDESEGE